MGEGLGRAIPGVAFLRTRVFRNAHPEDHPPRALSPLRPRSLTFAAAFDTAGGVQEAGVFTCVDAEAERNAWPRVLRTDGRTRTLRVYTLPSHTVLPPPEQRGVHFVPTHQPVLPYPV